jgi:hypothetical protein
VGRPHLEGWPHLPTAVPNETNSSYRPSTTSGARIESVQIERRWIIGPGAPPHLAAPMTMGPRAQPTSLTYKRILTPAGLNTQHWSISFPLFYSLRVGIRVAWELESSRASLGVPEESSSEFRYYSCTLSLFRLKYNSSYLSILPFESITFSIYFALEALTYSWFRLKLV